MFRYSLDQMIVNVAKVRIGGQPGEIPTALAGTIFYHGHKIVENDQQGIFDHSRAEELINAQSYISDETGNPSIVHVFAKSPEAFDSYLGFLDIHWDGPIILDSSDPKCRAYMAEMVSELGIADRSIYNSLNCATTPLEAEAIRHSEIDSAILLAYNPSESGVDGRMKMLLDGGIGHEMGLLAASSDLGINNVLLDPGVSPLGSGAGESLRFTVVAKAKLGLPVGSGMHNAASSWNWLGSRDKTVRLCCDTAATAVQQMASGDFVLYGPIERAPLVFPVAAMTDMLVAEAVKDLDIYAEAGHPLFRLA